MDTEPTTENNHDLMWIGGWSISAPEESLLRETFSPLEVSLAPDIGKILLKTPKISGELFMTDPADGTLTLFANGFRVTRETEEGTRLFSFYRVSPSSLIIEADDPHLDINSDGEIEQLDNGETIVATIDQHRMTIVADWKRSPVRMAVLAGSGEPEQLAARARALLAKSAHLALDQLIKDRVPDIADQPCIDPHSYLAGSFRPASQTWPGPWLAGEDDTTVLDGSILLLIAHVLSANKSPLLGGMIRNPLEAVSQIATDQHIIEEAARFPVLMQIMQRFPKEQEQWLDIAAACNAGIQAYLKEAGKPASFVPGAASPLATKLRPWLCKREYIAWKALAEKAGLSAIGSMPPAPKSSNDDPPWIVFLDEQRAASLDTSAIENALRPLIESLKQEESDDTPIYWAMAVLLINSATLLARSASRRNFRMEVFKLARENWNRRAESMRASGKVTHDPATLAIAAVAAWADRSSADDSADESEPSRAMLWRLSNRRRHLVLLAAVFVVLFVAWVISIQFRRTLPPSAFETRIGMIQHFYQTGDYQTALEKLDELESVGALSLGILYSWRGKVLYRQGEFEAAEESFTEAAEELKENPAPLYNIALSQFRRGDFAQAKASFEVLSLEFRATHPSIAARALRAAAICAEMNQYLEN